jgi:hypothetical protein
MAGRAGAQTNFFGIKFNGIPVRNRHNLKLNKIDGRLTKDAGET